jgi:hypothetical protein
MSAFDETPERASNGEDEPIEEAPNQPGLLEQR